MLIIALSPGPVALAVGVLVAGASSGLVFPPFADAVARQIASPQRGRVFAAISSGTGYGVGLAAPIAIAAGTAWRIAWLAYAALALLATTWAVVVLPGRAPRTSATPAFPWRLSWFACPRSRPLLIGALMVGLSCSLYWTFAVDYLVGEGGLGTTASRLLLVVVGAASLLGSGAAEAVRRAGARPAFAGVALALGASLALLALAPGSIALALLSAAIFGAAYNLLVAMQGIWSSRVFAERPSTGLAAVMFTLGCGLLLGPLLAGPLADRVGLQPLLLSAAVLLVGTGTLGPREPLLQP